MVEGTGVTYMTSQQGADHTAGNPARAETFAMDLAEVVALSFGYQVKSAALDSLGLCYMSAAVSDEAKTLVAEAIEDLHGVRPPTGYFEALGRETLKLEAAFTQRLGRSLVEPLPRFFYEEPLPPTMRRARLELSAVEKHWRALLEEA